MARTHSIAVVGVQGHPVEIETDIENGLPGLVLVGLPDTALREARDRIRGLGAVAAAGSVERCDRGWRTRRDHASQAGRAVARRPLGRAGTRSRAHGRGCQGRGPGCPTLDPWMCLRTRLPPHQRCPGL